MANDVTVKINGDAKGFKRAANDAEKAIDKLRKDTAQAAGKVGSKLGAGGLIGGGVAGIAVAGGMAIATKAVQQYQQAQEDALETLKRAGAEAAVATEHESKRAAAITGLTNSLLQYCSAEKVSNENKEKAIQLLQQMERRYGALNIAIDENGRVSEESIAKAEKAAIQRQITAVKSEMASNTEAAKQAGTMADDWISVATGKSGDYARQQEEFVNKNRKLAETIKELNIRLEEVDINIENRKKLETARKADAEVKSTAEYDKALASARAEQNRVRGPGDLATERERYIQDRMKSAPAGITEEQRNSLISEYGNTFDVKQAEASRRSLDAWNKDLEVQQLEIRGLREEASLMKKINAEEERKGRALTEQERLLLQGQNAAEWAAVKAEEKASRAALGRPEVANPFALDNLMQMGERVNVSASINYPARTFDAVESIKKIAENINQKIEKANMNKNFGVFP